MNIKCDNPFGYPNHALTQRYKFCYVYRNVVAYRLTLFFVVGCTYKHATNYKLHHHTIHIICLKCSMKCQSQGCIKLNVNNVIHLGLETISPLQLKFNST
jgi:hypothetical protein